MKRIRASFFGPRCINRRTEPRLFKGTYVEGLKLSHLATNRGGEVPVGDRNELNETTYKAVLADLLSNTSLRIAGNEVGEDAYTAVVEASEQTVLKLSRHRSLERRSLIITRQYFKLTVTACARNTNDNTAPLYLELLIYG